MSSVDPAYSAVCYRCGFVGLGESAGRCPLCAFALILEPGQVPEQTPALADIFPREASDAPPLPGVDDEPRQAQILAELRRRRRPSTPRPVVARRLPARAAAADLDVDLRPSLARAFAVVSALVVGLVAVMMARGGL